MTSQAPLVGWLRDAVRREPQKVAIRFEADLWSYARLEETSLKIARVLENQGVHSGDRVALIGGATAEYIATLYGILAAGAAVVPLSPQYKEPELAFHLRHNKVVLAISTAALLKKVGAALSQAKIPAGLLAYGDSVREEPKSISVLAKQSEPIDSREVHMDAPAIVLHTSGSTGRSKIVPRSHRQTLAECENFSKTAKTTKSDVFFAAVPLYHCHGLYNCALASLYAAGTLVLQPQNLPITLVREQVVKLLESSGSTVFPGVPYQFEQLAAAEAKVNLSKLRLCFSAGAPLTKEIYKRFTARFGIPVRQLYGCSEGGAFFLNTADDVEGSWQSVGQPLVGVKAKILKPDKNGVGEIAVASGSLTTGYESQDDLNAQVFVEGYFHTGDMGRFDEVGNLYIVQRRSLYIDIAGYKVDPREVEDCLLSHEAVEEVVVLGIDEETANAAVKAVVVSKSDVSDKELKLFCLKRLAPYKVPTIFEFRGEIPKNAIGKILKKDLL